MKLLKRLFSAKTNDINYKKELVTLISLIIIFLIPVVIRLLPVEIPYKIIWYILGFIMLIVFYPCILFCGIRLLNVSDNKKKNKIKLGNYIRKEKFQPMIVRLEDVLLVIDKAKVGYEFSLKYNEKCYIIKVDFEDYKSSRKIGKKYFIINDKEYDNYLSFEADIKKEIISNNIYCLSIDDNDPKKVWNKIKIN